MEYLCCITGNTAEAQTQTHMLRVWFRCSQFVPSEYGVKIVATP
jgi:hypothetical protein